MGGSEAIGKVISALVISKQCSKQQNISFLFLIVISFILMTFLYFSAVIFSYAIKGLHSLHRWVAGGWIGGWIVVSNWCSFHACKLACYVYSHVGILWLERTGFLSFNNMCIAFIFIYNFDMDLLFSVCILFSFSIFRFLFVNIFCILAVAQHSIWGSEEAATCRKLSPAKKPKRKLVKTFEKLFSSVLHFIINLKC